MKIIFFLMVDVSLAYVKPKTDLEVCFSSFKCVGVGSGPSPRGSPAEEEKPSPSPLGVAPF